MTVAELIEELEKFDKDIDVVVLTSNGEQRTSIAVVLSKDSYRDCSGKLWNKEHLRIF